MGDMVNMAGENSFIRDLLEFVEVPATGTSSAKQATDLPIKDFEDARQAAAALAFGADYVVTRNVVHYRNSPVPPISPLELIADRLGFQRPRV